MAGPNRRRDHRVRVPVSIRYRLPGRDPKETWSPGVLADLAAGGLRFSCDRIVGEGDLLEFQILLPMREEPYRLSGVVVWVTPLTGGVECGVAFAELSGDAQFEIAEMVDFLNMNTLRPRPPKHAD